MKLINFIRKQNYNGICFVCGKEDIGNFQQLRKHILEDEDLSKVCPFVSLPHFPCQGLPDPARWREGDEHLVTLYGNDHFLWMLESFLEEKELEKNPQSHAALLGCASKEKAARDPKKHITELIKESRDSTVAGVEAEDLPPLESFANEELSELV